MIFVFPFQVFFFQTYRITCVFKNLILPTYYFKVKKNISQFFQVGLMSSYQN